MQYLSIAKRGYVSQGSLIEVENAILHKLKSGCQWHQLPVEHIFEDVVLSRNAVCPHFRKWCRLGEWQTIFAALVRKYKDRLDMSVTHIVGSHTPALKGSEFAEYQEYKKRKTTNSLYFCDRQGLPLAMSEPQKGNHADLYEIEGGSMGWWRNSGNAVCAPKTFSTMPTPDLTPSTSGLRWRALKSSLTYCHNPRNGEPAEDYLFDDELYKERFVIERTNVRMDGFRSILTRFDTTISS